MRLKQPIRCIEMGLLGRPLFLFRGIFLGFVSALFVGFLTTCENTINEIHPSADVSGEAVTGKVVDATKEAGEQSVPLGEVEEEQREPLDEVESDIIPPPVMTSLQWSRTLINISSEKTAKATWKAPADMSDVDQIYVHVYANQTCSGKEYGNIHLEPVEKTILEKEILFSENGHYSFKVRAMDGSGNQSSSGCLTESQPPLRVALSHPTQVIGLHWAEANPTNKDTLTAEWTNPTSQSFAAQKITFYIGPTCEGQPLGEEKDVTGQATTSVAIPENLRNGVREYTFLVKNIDDADNVISICSNLSTQGVMIVDKVPPSPPTFAVVPELVTSRRIPTLSWQPSEDSVRYAYQWVRVVPGTDPPAEANLDPTAWSSTPTPQFTPTMVLGSYKLFVRAYDLADNVSTIAAQTVTYRLFQPTQNILSTDYAVPVIADTTPLFWVKDFNGDGKKDLMRADSINGQFDMILKFCPGTASGTFNLSNETDVLTVVRDTNFSVESVEFVDRLYDSGAAPAPGAAPSGPHLVVAGDLQGTSSITPQIFIYQRTGVTADTHVPVFNSTPLSVTLPYDGYGDLQHRFLDVNFNGDGKMDILLLQKTGDQIYQLYTLVNNGNGGFDVGAERTILSTTTPYLEIGNHMFNVAYVLITPPGGSSQTVEVVLFSFVGGFISLPSPSGTTPPFLASVPLTVSHLAVFSPNVFVLKGFPSTGGSATSQTLYRISPPQGAFSPQGVGWDVTPLASVGDGKFMSLDDVDHDGFLDVVFSMPETPPPTGSSVKEAFVAIHGSATGLTSTSAGQTSSPFLLVDDTDPYAVLTDLNGDGWKDLVVLGQYGTNTRLSVFYGEVPR